MSGVDTTFHVSDLLAMAGFLGGVIGFGARAITRAVKHKIAEIDRRLADHGNTLSEHAGTLEKYGRRLGDVEGDVEYHAKALQRLGFHRDANGLEWRGVPEKDGM